MKKRIIAWIILLAVLFSVVPAWAAPIGPVENFTVEQDGGVITVTPPEGYAEKGYYKLFWKNETTGEIRSEVFPVDTPSFRIDAEEGAEYSFQLHYAKQKGKLPSVWKEDRPEETPSGPSVWKVLWIDAPTVDFRGITTQMSEENYQASGEIAQAFEAFAEELTLGRVDIEITRMTLDTPVTELEYSPETGYFIDPDNCDMKHYAMRKYDAVFVIGRFERILRRYNGVTVQVDNPKETPGYSFIPLYADDIEVCGGIDYLRDVCVHEWIHQLVFLYETYHLQVPDPDESEKYGYAPYLEGGGLDHGLFRDALTMTAVSEDGRYIGVPEGAWQYKPTHYAQKNLSALQQEKVPDWPVIQAEEPAPAETALADIDPAVFGTLDAVNGIYDNAYMGLSLNLSGCSVYSVDNLPYGGTSADIREDDPEFIKNDDSVLALFAANASEPADVSLIVSKAPAQFIRENGEEAYLLELQKNFERWADQYKPAEFSSELIERKVAGQTMPGIRLFYMYGDIPSWQEILIRQDDDHLNTITVNAFMFDIGQDMLDRFTRLD